MKPYEAGGSKQQQVRTMFDRIAPRYDRLNHILSFGVDRIWRRRLRRLVRAGEPARALDLATGTGDMAIELARGMAHCRVTGADLSPGMLARAREKIHDKGLDGRIDLVAAAAEALPFADGEFDAVTVVFGVRNFDDLPRSLAEIHRVLRHGGRLHVMEFSTPRGRVFGPVYRWYFHRVLPRVGGLLSGDRRAYDYLPGSVDEFPGPEGFMQMLSAAGFRECTARRMTRGIAYIYSAEK